MNKHVRKLALAGAAGLLLTGCAVRTSYRTPTVPLPEAYSAGRQDAAVRAETADLKEWWKEFHDSELDSLVARALDGNLDLKIARERVREARATRGYTAATRQLPTTAATGGMTQRSTGGQSFTSRDSSLYQTGFDASYELDLFGGARASVKAAEADAQATEEAVNGTLVTVAAETARNYLELREAQERLDVARKTLAAQNETLRLTELRQKAGLTSDFDTTRARALVESTEAGIPVLEAQAQASMHAIALLLGVEPGKVEAELAPAGSMPDKPPEIPVGLPSDLLRRRPDIREAERGIAGSAARVGVAVSNLYPKFSLTSQAGGQSSALMNILSGAARLWSFGSSFSWGLLNYPATKANIQAAESREQQTMAAYEKTVLSAMKDVEDALASYTAEKQRQVSLVQAADANRKAVELANIRYSKGLSTFLDVLDAQRSLYSSQDSLAQSRGNVNTYVVALYKAVGGGW